MAKSGILLIRSTKLSSCSRQGGMYNTRAVNRHRPFSLQFDKRLFLKYVWAHVMCGPKSLSTMFSGFSPNSIAMLSSECIFEEIL